MLVDKESICPTDGLNQKFLPEKDESGKLRVKILESLSEEDLSVKLLKEINVDHLTDKIWSECDARGRPFKDAFLEFSQLYFKDEKVFPVPQNACKTCQFKIQAHDNSDLLSGFQECWQQALGYDEQDFKDPTILDLWNFSKKDKCFQAGLIKLKDFEESDLSITPDDKPGISASERQWKQIEKIKNNDDSVWIDEQGLRHEIESWQFPLHFIDFETAMLPIPFSKGAHPYQGIAFQFSHHTLDENGVVKHADEYLNTEPGIDPSIEFVRSLKTALANDNGTIFRYSSHENTYLNQILNLLKDMAEPPDDKKELVDFIMSITKSTKDSRKKWLGDRCMIDLWELVKRYYYDPMTNGSNSIKKVFPAVLSRSQYLQDKYSQPIYGSSEGISSKNFEKFQWIVRQNGEIADPYALLDPINKDVPNDKIELLFDDEYLKEGGAATIAYAKLQFTHMSSFEREALRKALLKYCELDTLAMVMIVEAWMDMLR